MAYLIQIIALLEMCLDLVRTASSAVGSGARMAYLQGGARDVKDELRGAPEEARHKCIYERL